MAVPDSRLAAKVSYMSLSMPWVVITIVIVIVIVTIIIVIVIVTVIVVTIIIIIIAGWHYYLSNATRLMRPD